MIDAELFHYTVNNLVKGLGFTVYIGLVSIILSLGVGLLFALMRVSRNRLISSFAFGYSTVFRGTPLLVQLFILYYGIGTLDFIRHSPTLWWLFNDGAKCAILAIALNSGAYISEVFRGGFQSVPVGQVEAAKAIGMSPWKRFHRITFPLAIRQALPAYSNEIVLVIKGTSLASTIAVMELTGYAKRLMNQNYAIIETFVIAGLLYLLINFTLLALINLLERWLKVSN
ncbi:ABC transporter permease subunit [Paenalcaligenes niemegkensis]|uniref:ABC transporter permease n=1 Tax=Paenalcaligenes niemegkensis TaxID=2895469 RepID=UPI001EE7A8CC|nr:ABC transporter permease subunit [Paenalcaligenes niemegkensis]MCQ9617635.1 ABC transporter permease subunit [Paenalcaligenes niemegkensis]